MINCVNFVICVNFVYNIGNIKNVCKYINKFCGWSFLYWYVLVMYGRVIVVFYRLNGRSYRLSGFKFGCFISKEEFFLIFELYLV